MFLLYHYSPLSNQINSKAYFSVDDLHRLLTTAKEYHDYYIISFLVHFSEDETRGNFNKTMVSLVLESIKLAYDTVKIFETVLKTPEFHMLSERDIRCILKWFVEANQHLRSVTQYASERLESDGRYYHNCRDRRRKLRNDYFRRNRHRVRYPTG